MCEEIIEEMKNFLTKEEKTEILKEYRESLLTEAEKVSIKIKELENN